MTIPNWITRVAFNVVTLACAAGLGASCSPPPKSVTSGVSPDSVRRFTQAFYDWYVPTAHGSGHRQIVDVAVRTRPETFDSVLAQALREDSDDGLDAPAEGGLSFDPFLASQHPCSHYEVLRPDFANGLYRARIHGNCVPGANQPGVIAEVGERRGRLVFVNFRYPPSGGDLLGILKDPAERRRGR